MTPGRQTLIGVGFAAGVIVSWMCLFVWGVFLHEWSRWDIAIVPAFILIQAWLSMAMFIIAHDAIHGTLAPKSPRLGALIGQICVGLYAGFSFRKLSTSHHLHHASPGDVVDPDFHAAAPRAFMPWIVAFIRRYFGWAEFARLTLGFVICLLLGASLPDLLVFWAAPAVLSAIQLFYFGTYLPHRHEDAPFADRHHARSLKQPFWLSFLSCLHFGGYHHEHHLKPELCWWRLPSARS